MSDAGDLGRRVEERRRILHLDVADLAERAGMSPTYLQALEADASLQPSTASLWNLAAALECTVADITGGGLVSPPGRTDPSGRPAIEHLTHGECGDLIAPGGIGRFVFVDERGPVAWPVNFRMLDGDVVFRTAAESPALCHVGGGETSFEVDRFDDALAEGWSVLLTGTSRVITDAEERESAEALGVTPWSGGTREIFVRLSPRTTTGRRIRRTTAGARR